LGVSSLALAAHLRGHFFARSDETGGEALTRRLHIVWALLRST